jgi:beta-carotene hydroxylase
MQSDCDFPSLQDLDRDLMRVSAWRRLIVVVRPFLACSLYWLFANLGWWWAALMSLAAMMFLTYTSTSHDYVHRTLGLPRLLNDCLLTLTELLGLRSGHAFRLVHLNHHRHFPNETDVEGYAAAQGFLQALLAGPGHPFRTFLWAWRHASSQERRFLIFEAAAVCYVLFEGWFHHPIAVYSGLVIVSGWLYPLATVWWPHRREGVTAIEHTRAIRGRLIPALFLHHTYHLEHHLYPMVASVNWRKLAQRLDPHLRKAGVRPILIP